MEDELRELLQRQADRLPPHRQVPQQMLRRARRRVAVTTAGAVLVVAALAFGSYTGVQALGRTRSLQPIGQGRSPGSSHPLPGNNATPAPCVPADFTVSAEIQGAAGQRYGSLVFRNKGAYACTLNGRPSVEFLDDRGGPMVGVVDVVPTAAWWQVNGGHEPPGWPLVNLRFLQSAVVRMSWANWCGPGQPKTWRILFPNHMGSVDLAWPTDTPPCNGPSMPSTLQIGPFEPQA